VAVTDLASNPRSSKCLLGFVCPETSRTVYIDMCAYEIDPVEPRAETLLSEMCLWLYSNRRSRDTILVRLIRALFFERRDELAGTVGGISTQLCQEHKFGCRVLGTDHRDCIFGDSSEEGSSQISPMPALPRFELSAPKIHQNLLPILQMFPGPHVCLRSSNREYI
jgi:hypothetical protein